MICPECEATLACGACGVVVNQKEPATILALFTPEALLDMRKRFPGIDLEWEAQRCTTWYTEARKQLKKPRSAYMSWVAREFKRNPPEQTEQTGFY